MRTYIIKPQDVPGTLVKQHDEVMARLLRAVRVTVKTAGPAIAQEEVDRGTARKRPPINVGTYRSGWQARDLPAGGVLFNDTPYAIFIENGRRPGSRMPPLEPIRQWLEQKLRGRIKNRRKREAEARSAAFVVARAIAKRGLPAHRIMAKTRKRLDPMVAHAVAAALRGEG